MPYRFAITALTAFSGLLVFAGSDSLARPAAKRPRHYVQTGQTCTVEIHRYSKIVEMDRHIFNVFQNFAQIDADIAAAATACRAGRDAEARAIVVASERSHGYPWPL